jgi:hypothetical protein
MLKKKKRKKKKLKRNRERSDDDLAFINDQIILHATQMAVMGVNVQQQRCGSNSFNKIRFPPKKIFH